MSVKKFVFVLLLVASVLVFSSCRKEPAEPAEVDDSKTSETVAPPVTDEGKDDKPVAETQSGMVALEIELPPLLLAGTPKNMKGIANLEATRAKGVARATMLVPAGTTNVALNKPITSTSMEPIVGMFKDITDGDKAGGNYVELDPFEQSITIDLGASYEIYAIVMWHYHKEQMVYYDVVVQTADDADFITNVNTLFNNDTDNTHGLGSGEDKNYLENYEGKLIDAKGVIGRFVKCLSGANSSNDMNHYIEVEVYGKPAK